MESNKITKRDKTHNLGVLSVTKSNPKQCKQDEQQQHQKQNNISAITNPILTKF